jgi:hypothetical protein
MKKNLIIHFKNTDHNLKFFLLKAQKRRKTKYMVEFGSFTLMSAFIQQLKMIVLETCRHALFDSITYR